MLPDELGIVATPGGGGEADQPRFGPQAEQRGEGAARGIELDHEAAVVSIPRGERGDHRRDATRADGTESNDAHQEPRRQKDEARVTGAGQQRDRVRVSFATRNDTTVDPSPEVAATTLRTTPTAGAGAPRSSHSRSR